MSKQHQKSEGLCNNREELTGKKLPFPNCPFREQNAGRSNLGPGPIPLSYHPVPRHLCNKGFTGLTWYGKKSPPCENFGSLRHVAACCCRWWLQPDKAPVTKERRCGRSPTQKTLRIIRGGGSRALDPPTRLKTHPPRPPPPLQKSSYKRSLIILSTGKIIAQLYLLTPSAP